ncbi:MAG: hypothetical protein RLZZ487_1682, partial [Pseudomonadota bacterium]
MNIGAGWIIAFGCSIFGFIWLGGHIEQLWVPEEYLIIFGAALGTLMASNKWRNLKSMFRAFFRIFLPSNTGKTSNLEPILLEKPNSQKVRSLKPSKKPITPMTPEERPKLKIQLTPTDQIFELLGWGVLLALWIWTGTSYSSLPDTIPTHFNAAGEADGFGRKASIVSLPVVASLLYIGLTLLNRVPHSFNFPTPITQDNALRQY